MSASDPYLEYLARFHEFVGAVAVGGYGSYKGQLIRKLAPHEFAAKHDEFAGLNAHYQKSLERGDTVNDTVSKLIREHRAELLLEGE